MIDTPLLEALTLVLLGGLFGWLLGHLPDKYVYLIMAATFALVIVTLTLNS